MIKSIQLAGRVYTCRPLIIYSKSNSNNIIQQKDGQVLCAKGTSIVVVSIETGEQIGIFQDHNATVSCLALINSNNSNNNRILSCSLDGAVIAWNLDTFQQYNQFSLNVPIFEVIIPYHANNGDFLSLNNNSNDDNDDEQNGGKKIYSKDELYFVVGKSTFFNEKNDKEKTNKKEKDNGRKEKDLFKLIAYDTAAKKIRRKVTNLKYGINNVVSIFIKEEEFIVAATRTKLLLWSIDSKELVGPKFNSEIGSITSLTANSEKGIIVTGHNHGEIVIWHDLPAFISQSSGKASPTCTILHWHAHPVASLSLSPDGQNLYTGGEEGVLVVWQLSAGTKSFLPRLGASITHLSSSPIDAKVVIASMDNSVRLVNIASLKEEWTLRSLYTLPPQKQGTVDDDDERYEPDIIALARTPSLYSFTPADSKFKVCKIVVEKRSGQIICNGYPGQLQSYDLLTQTMSSSHEIIQFSHVSKKESFTKMYVPCTTHFDFIKVDAGDIMTTVDVRRGEDTLPEISLKFWMWDVEKKKYVLNAQVDSPHGSSKISAVALTVPYTPKKLQKTEFSLSCCTSADDGSVKVWKASMVPILGSSKTAIQWSCAFAYKYRDSPVKHITFSPDGSLLAVCQENFISFWDPTNVTLKTSILGASSSNITFAAFIEPKRSIQLGGGAGISMLVVGTKKSLSVYDLIEMKLMWIINGRFSAFAVASSERETIQISNAKSNENFAWIAAASLRHDSVNNVKSYELLLFSPFQSTQLHCEKSNSKIVSISFWNNVNDLYSPCGGIISMTHNGDMTFLSLGSTIDSTLKMKDFAAAQISKKVLPSIDIDSGTLLHKNDNEKVNKQAIPKGGWLSRIFDSSTENIPPISVLYDGYMSNLLLAKQSTSEPFDQSFSVGTNNKIDVVGIDDDSDNENTNTGTKKKQVNEIVKTRNRKNIPNADDEGFDDDLLEALHNSVQSIFKPNSAPHTSLGRRSRSNSATTEINDKAKNTPATKKSTPTSKPRSDSTTSDKSLKARSNSITSGSRPRSDSFNQVSPPVNAPPPSEIQIASASRSRTNSIDNQIKTPATVSRSRTNSVDIQNSKRRANSADKSEAVKVTRSTRAQSAEPVIEKVEKGIETEVTGRTTRSNSQVEQIKEPRTRSGSVNSQTSTKETKQASKSADKNDTPIQPAVRATRANSIGNDKAEKVEDPTPLKKRKVLNTIEEEKVEETPRRSTRSRKEAPILNIKDANNKMKL